MTPTESATAPGSASGEASPADEVSLPILDFAQGLPGFPDVHRFTVIPLKRELRPFSRLVCLEKDNLEFIVVPPRPLFPDYSVEIDDDNVEKLDLKDASEAVVLLIVQVKAPPEVPSANLLAPIVINARTKSAAQIVLHSSGYSADTPLPTDKDK